MSEIAGGPPTGDGSASPSFETVGYDVSGRVAHVVMNRPEKRNAQNTHMTYELDAALDLAARNRDVRVVILAGAGPHFSAGHDLTDPHRYEEPSTGVTQWADWELEGAEGRLSREHEIYFEMCRRWREFPKPLIAKVHGRCIGGGLMLAWVCDLIVASADAVFQDPVVSYGMPGVEWLAHPWELGPRKAKELLWTAGTWSAQEALSCGMVNHVVGRDELDAFTVSLAERIAMQQTMAVKLVKQAVNQAMDNQGYWTAMCNAFHLHQLAHAHNSLRYDSPLDPTNLPARLRVAAGRAIEEP
jgi:enoyl-CoA hydratase